MASRDSDIQREEARLRALGVDTEATIGYFVVKKAASDDTDNAKRNAGRNGSGRGGEESNRAPIAPMRGLVLVDAIPAAKTP